MPSPKPKKPSTPRRAPTKPEANGTSAPVVAAPIVAAAVVAAPTDEAIRIAAYYKWVAAGCPPGDDQAFWYEAERELRGNGHTTA